MIICRRPGTLHSSLSKTQFNHQNFLAKNPKSDPTIKFLRTRFKILETSSGSAHFNSTQLKFISNVNSGPIFRPEAPLFRYKENHQHKHPPFPLSLSLFFLPFAFSLLTFTSTILQSTLFQSDILTSINIPSYKSLLLPLVYTLSIFILALSGLATITHTTYYAFCGEKVNVFTSIKSLSHSLIRLALTSVAAAISIISICLIFSIFVLAAIKVVQILGFQIDYSSISFAAIIAVVLGSILILFFTNWGLAGVIVVTESKWGFEPLFRSTYLLKGVRSESFFIILFCLSSIGVMIWANSVIVLSYGDNWWTNWALVFQAVAASSYIVLIMLQYSVSSTVLYMYCMALHGELAAENASEFFSREYVSLKVSDDKEQQISLPDQESKDEPNGVFEYLFLFLTVYWSLLGLFMYFFSAKACK